MGKKGKKKQVPSKQKHAIAKTNKKLRYFNVKRKETSKESGVVVIVTEKSFENWETLKKKLKNRAILAW